MGPPPERRAVYTERRHGRERGSGAGQGLTYKKKALIAPIIAPIIPPTTVRTTLNPPIAMLCRIAKRLPATTFPIAAWMLATIEPTYSVCEYVGLYAT